MKLKTPKDFTGTPETLVGTLVELSTAKHILTNKLFDSEMVRIRKVKKSYSQQLPEKLSQRGKTKRLDIYYTLENKNVCVICDIPD